MAPEAPGNIVVVDSQFDGTDLRGVLDSIDYPAQNVRAIEAGGGWLNVYWSAAPVGHISLGRGVLYVREPPAGYEIMTRVPVEFESLGNSTFGYRHPARGEGFMFVLLLPEGFTLTRSDPEVRSAKIFQDRLAVYWKPDAGYDREATITWQLARTPGNLVEERDRINRRSYGNENAPTNAGANVVDRRVFIGHGRSETWRVLKDFLSDKLRLPYEEFNRQSAAGYTTKERLEQMLNSSGFAFLVMTADDEHADGTRHARENVVHEIGLFQGRHGFHRAIVLVEEGCEEFSNIRGVTQLRFPKGRVLAVSEDIRDVLAREGLLSAT
jgi:hypothetical protein